MSPLARELSDLAQRLARLTDQVEALEAERVEPQPESGAVGVEAGRLLTAAEVSERTGLGRGAVYRIARKGGLGAVKFGERGVRFSERGLAEWERQGGAS